MNEVVLGVAFDRIGRHHDPESLVLDVPERANRCDELAEQIHRHARRYLGSREVEVLVQFDPDTNTGEGMILVGGFRNAGSFTITPEPAEVTS